MAMWGLLMPRAGPARSSLIRPFCRLSTLRGLRSAIAFMVNRLTAIVPGARGQ